MQRLIALLAVGIVLAACSGGETVAVDDGATSAPTTTAVTTTTSPHDAAPAGALIEQWDLSAVEVTLTQPPLWRSVTAPPEGAHAAAYAPSDNNVVAERVLVTAAALPAASTASLQIEAAYADLDASYVVVTVLETTQTQIGVDASAATRIRFTWEQPGEAGVGWRWVFPADSQLIFITYLADLSEPGLYLDAIETMLNEARIGG